MNARNLPVELLQMIFQFALYKPLLDTQPILYVFFSTQIVGSHLHYRSTNFGLPLDGRDERKRAHIIQRRLVRCVIYRRVCKRWNMVVPLVQFQHVLSVRRDTSSLRSLRNSLGVELGNKHNGSRVKRLHLRLVSNCPRKQFLALQILKHCTAVEHLVFG